MIPTRHDYYKRRAREHRRLASLSTCVEQRLAHEKLVEAYLTLARRYRLKQTVALRTDTLRLPQVVH